MFDPTASHLARLRLGRQRQAKLRQRRRDGQRVFRVDVNQADLVQLLRDWNLIDAAISETLNLLFLQLLGEQNLDDVARKVKALQQSSRITTPKRRQHSRNGEKSDQTDGSRR